MENDKLQVAYCPLIVDNAVIVSGADNEWGSIFKVGWDSLIVWISVSPVADGSV